MTKSLIVYVKIITKTLFWFFYYQLYSEKTVKLATLMVSKVTVKNDKHSNILMETVQGAIANGVLDSVRQGHIPKDKANELEVIVSVWINPIVTKEKDWY